MPYAYLSEKESTSERLANLLDQRFAWLRAIPQVPIQTIQRDACLIELSQNSIVNSSVHIGPRIRVTIESHCIGVPVFQNSSLNVARNPREVLL